MGGGLVSDVAMEIEGSPTVKPRGSIDDNQSFLLAKYVVGVVLLSPKRVENQLVLYSQLKDNKPVKYTFQLRF